MEAHLLAQKMRVVCMEYCVASSITRQQAKSRSVFGLQGRGTDSQAVADPWRLQIHVWERSTSKAVVSSISPAC